MDYFQRDPQSAARSNARAMLTYIFVSLLDILKVTLARLTDTKKMGFMGLAAMNKRENIFFLFPCKQPQPKREQTVKDSKRFLLQFRTKQVFKSLSKREPSMVEC